MNLGWLAEAGRYPDARPQVKPAPLGSMSHRVGSTVWKSMVFLHAWRVPGKLVFVALVFTGRKHPRKWLYHIELDRIHQDPRSSLRGKWQMWQDTLIFGCQNQWCQPWLKLENHSIDVLSHLHLVSETRVFRTATAPYTRAILKIGRTLILGSLEKMGELVLGLRIWSAPVSFLWTEAIISWYMPYMLVHSGLGIGFSDSSLRRAAQVRCNI